MSAVSEFNAVVDAKFTEIGESVDAIVASHAGIAGDVNFLKDTILKLENNPGPISPEDQALLTAAVDRVNGLATKTNGVRDALKALDEATETPPVPPA